VQDWKAEVDKSEAPYSPTNQSKPPVTKTDQATKPEVPVTKPAAGNVMDKIKELSALREAGMITEEEFVEMKRKLIADM